MIRDPVCGMMVDEKTSLTSRHEEKEYHFCSANCKSIFEENPHKFH